MLHMCYNFYILPRSTKLYRDVTKTRPCNISAIFHGSKNDNFQMKNCDIFLIFAQNINRGYTLEPPQKF